MLFLAFSMGRRRLSALLAVACAVLGGAALVTATGVLAETGLRSHLPVGRLAAADVVISADQTVRPAQAPPIALPERRPIPVDLVSQVAQLPGVEAVVGDLSFPAALVDAGNDVVPSEDPRSAGHGWSSTTLLTDLRVVGTPPSGAHDVALDSASAAAVGAEPGDRVRLIVAGRSAAYRVTAVIGASRAGIFFADSTARQLAGRESGSRAGTVDLIVIRTAPGAAEPVATAVRNQLPKNGFTVSTGSSRADAAALDVGAARSLLVLMAGSLAGTILLIVGFVIAGALAVSISAQRRELALLRAVGATPAQIRRLAATQAMVVAGAALLPGVALGYLLAGLFRRLLVDIGMIPATLPLSLSPIPAVAAMLLLVVVVQVSARGGAWRTSRMPATEAVAESRSEPRAPSVLRTRGGLLLIAVAGTLSVAPLLSRSPITAAMTSMAGIVAAIGLALVGPALVRALSAGLARRLPRRVSAPTWLAVSNTHGYALRVAGAVTTLAMAVVFLLTYALAQSTLMSATSRDVSAGMLAENRITAAAVGGVPDDLLTKVRATAGVRTAATYSSTTVLWSYRQFGDVVVESGPALVLAPAEAPAVLDLDVRAGSLSELTGDTVAVGSDVARSRRVRTGQQLQLTLGDGTAVTARVVAIYARSLGFGSVVLSSDLAAGHTTTGLDQSILVRTDGTAEAHRNLAQLVASRPGVLLSSTDERTTDRRALPPETWINLATVLVLLGYLLLGIANKLVAGTAQRRNEIAVLQLIGTTPRQIRAMMRREAALITVAALATGLLLSAVPLMLLGIGFLGRPWPAGPAWLLPAITLTVAGIAFSAIEIPTRQALRTAPLAVRVS